MAEPKVRRSRVRAVDTGNQAAARPKMPPKLKELATTVFTENKAMNAHKRKHDAARKSLTGELNDLKVDGENTDFNYGTTIEGKRVEIEVSLVEGTTTVIDMAKLKNLIGEEAYEAIVTTTKTAITEKCGSTVADQVIKTKGNGKFTAKVSAAK